MTKIGDGKNYDTTNLAKGGISFEEFKKLVKNETKLINIYNSFDSNKDGTLSKEELANALGAYQAMDTDKNQNLSGKELEAFADIYNQNNQTNITGNNLKSFLKNLVKSMQGKESVSTDSALQEQNQNQALTNLEQPKERLKLQKAPEFKADDNELKPQEKNPTYTYTVQEGEKYGDIIKNSLAQKGIKEPTKAQIEEEMKRFEEANPDAVKTSKKGVKFLLAGAKVNLEGHVGDKDNSREQINKYNDKYGKANKTIETPLEDGSKKVEKYDENGNLSIIIVNFADGRLWTVTNEYDENNNCIKQMTVRKDIDGNLTSTIEESIEYDKNNSGTKSTFVKKDAIGNIRSSREKTYRYDRNGHFIGDFVYKDAKGNQITPEEFNKL